MKWLLKYKLLIVLALVIAAYAVVIDNQNRINISTAASKEAACQLDPQTFLTTVNQWRASKGVAPLQYSTQLQSAAQARIADMEKYQYYGHTNPSTGQTSQHFIDSADPAAGYSSEILDGPNSAASSISEFMNSPEHYNAIVSDNYKYLGFVSRYLPEQWAEYDNSGKLQLAAGHPIWYCLVVGELADSVGQRSPVAAQSAQSVTPQQPQMSNTQAQFCINITNEMGIDLQIDAQKTKAYEDSQYHMFYSELASWGCKPQALYEWPFGVPY